MATALPERPLPPVPPAARAIALLLASTPSVTDAPPRVLQQLLEFSYRYTAQILQEAQVYADHAGRPGRLSMDDVTLAIQARVGYEFGGRVPKEYILGLAAKTNAEQLPPIPETFGIRLPPPEHCLVQTEWDLNPNAPPPEDPLYEEFEEEVTDEGADEEESEEESQADEEMADGDEQPPTNGLNGDGHEGGSPHEDLFDGEDEDEDASRPAKRKLEEDDDYD